MAYVDRTTHLGIPADLIDIARIHLNKKGIDQMLVNSSEHPHSIIFAFNDTKMRPYCNNCQSYFTEQKQESNGIYTAYCNKCSRKFQIEYVTRKADEDLKKEERYRNEHSITRIKKHGAFEINDKWVPTAKIIEPKRID